MKTCQELTGRSVEEDEEPQDEKKEELDPLGSGSSRGFGWQRW